LSLFKGLSDSAINEIKNEWANQENIQPKEEKRPSIDREKIINQNRESNIVARTLFHEARGEGEIGMRAVGSVIYNRSKRRNRSFSQIATQPNQFSVWKDRDTSFTDESKNFTSPKDLKMWDKALQISKEMVLGGFRPITQADHFHTHNVNPSWSQGLIPEIIGNHKFFQLWK